MKNNGQDHIIRISQNENPLGPSPKALEAILKHSASVHRYPEPHSHSLRQKLAHQLGISADMVFVSAGLVESLDIVIRNFVGVGNNMVIGETTFVAYRLLGEVFGVETRFAKLNRYTLDMEEMWRCCDEKTRLIIIANPNNPTGTINTQAELERLLRRLPSEVLVVVDEAYREYVTQEDYPDSLAMLDRYANLVIMRTFSKIYGLAGQRVGYTIAHPSVVEKMDHFQAPFTVNGLGALAAFHALDDRDFVEKSAAMNLQERQLVYREFARRCYHILPSQANFHFVYFDQVEERNQFQTLLRKHKILAQATDAFGENKALRLSIGTPEENLKLISILPSVKGQTIF